MNRTVRLLESFEQQLVVTRVLEDGSPGVATGRRVVDRAGVFEPRRFGHRPIGSHGARPKNRKPDLTPPGPSLFLGLAFQAARFSLRADNPEALTAALVRVS